MLDYYLVQKHEDQDSCRGGVGLDNGTYQLEIGNNCAADPEIMAFLIHMPEIQEFLKNQFEHSSIARMIVKSISKEVETIRLNLAKGQ